MTLEERGCLFGSFEDVVVWNADFCECFSRLAVVCRAKRDGDDGAGEDCLQMASECEDGGTVVPTRAADNHRSIDEVVG